MVRKEVAAVTKVSGVLHDLRARYRRELGAGGASHSSSRSSALRM